MSDRRSKTDEAPRGGEDATAPSSSPPCYAEMMDPVYAGYLPRDELIGLLDVLLESERAGAKVLAVYRRQAPEDATALLAEVGRDEARYCAMLTGLIEELGGTPGDRTGSFYEKALAVESFDARVAFLNRGQRWVARRLAEALPKIQSDAVHAALKEMLATHEANIARCDALIRDRT